MVAASSAGSISAARAAGGPSRASRARSSSAPASSGCPPKSQITVRNLSSRLKQRPLSMAQSRSSAKRTWPLLRSALLATTSNAASRMSTGCHAGSSRSVK